MPSLVVADVAWSTPDGHRLFSNLSLEFMRERVGLVGRNGVGKTTLLRLLSGDLEPERGRVVRNGTVRAMRQIAQVDRSERVADLLGIADDIALLRRAEAGTATLEELAEIDWALEAEAEAALASVGLNLPLDARLTSLSGGQRTRAALAGATLGRPDFLLLDEPTNDLDADSRQAVAELLSGWRSGAIVVSHDRSLLEGMDAIVELSSLGAARYGGGFSAYRDRKAIELTAAEDDLASAERRSDEVKRRAQQTREHQQRRDATGARKAARGDMPKILIGARANRAENNGGGNARLAERRRVETQDALAEARKRVERPERWSVDLASTGLVSGRRVLDMSRVTGGHVPGTPVLVDINLSIVGPERLAIAGPNGSGKSTLLALAAGRLTPWSGHVDRHVHAAYFDQKMELLAADMTVIENFARLNPEMDNNSRRAALARFGFRASVAERPVMGMSGGETLRAALACILGGVTPPPLLLLDEPTNHLDLESLGALEAALNAYDGALLIVSHDPGFLEAIGISRQIAM